jgi:hypothetical protein
MEEQMYEIDGTRADLAREFLEKPYGIHSPELKAALDVLRLVHPNGKLILICTKPNREWSLAELAGDPVRAKLLPGMVFNDLANAERAVFKMRWRLVTGVDLDASPAR